MKIALSTLFNGSEIPREWDDWMDDDEDYIRTSEIVEIEFTPLPDEDVVPKKLAVINNQINQVRVEMGQKIAKLKEERSKLLAITHDD